MGIKRLMELINEKCPESITIVNRHVYKGKKLAIDAYVVIRKMTFRFRQFIKV